MHKQTIALIDDDRNILTSLSIALEKEGFKVQTYIDGESALIGLTRTPPDLAVVDIKMPKMDGEELLKKLRKKTSLPVIFLTSKDDEIDELLGLKLGADDFVKKSGGFSIKVLIERIRVQLRKKDSKNILEENKSLISHGRLKLDPSQLECEWNNKQLPDKLTTTGPRRPRRASRRRAGRRLSERAWPCRSVAPRLGATVARKNALLFRRMPRLFVWSPPRSGLSGRCVHHDRRAHDQKMVHRLPR